MRNLLNSKSAFMEDYVNSQVLFSSVFTATLVFPFYFAYEGNWCTEELSEIKWLAQPRSLGGKPGVWTCLSACNSRATAIVSFWWYETEKTVVLLLHHWQSQPLHHNQARQVALIPGHRHLALRSSSPCPQWAKYLRSGPEVLQSSGWQCHTAYIVQERWQMCWRLLHFSGEREVGQDVHVQGWKYIYGVHPAWTVWRRHSKTSLSPRGRPVSLGCYKRRVSPRWAGRQSLPFSG